MSHFILLHGFNDPSAGKKNIDKSAPMLIRLGHTVDTDGEDYGKFGICKVRFKRHPVIARIVTAIRLALNDGKDVVVVGYSNGANFGISALRLIFSGTVKLVLVHPALPTRFELPDSASRCWVCFTRSDWAVRLASYIRWLIPGWGRAGAVGYKGKDPRVINMDYSDVASRHGGLWKEGALGFFVQELDRFARESKGEANQPQARQLK